MNVPPTVTLPPRIGVALEAVTDGDRAWFEAHPHRAYRLRPQALGELMPGQTTRPGERVVVIRLGSPLVRMRLPVGRPPAGLRHDTDRTCSEIVRRLSAAGYAINGRPIAEALAAVRASFVKVLP